MSIVQVQVQVEGRKGEQSASSVTIQPGSLYSWYLCVSIATA